MAVRLDKYRIFVKVAQACNMNKAAQELCLTHSAVSHAIRDLETTLNVELFTRTPTNLVLTDQGRLLYNRIEQAVSDLERVENDFRHGDPMGKLHVCIATTHTLLKVFLLPCIDKLSSANPNADFSFSTGSISHAITAVADNRAEIGLVAVPEDSFIDSNLSWAHLQFLHEIFITAGNPPKHALSAAKLAEHPLITLPRDSKSFARYQEFFLKKGVYLEPKVEVRQMDLIFELVKKQVGIGIAYRELLDQDFAAGVHLVDTTCEIPPVSLTLIWRPTSEVGDRMAKQLRQIFLNRS